MTVGMAREMNDDRIVRLVRAALDLDELQEAEQGDAAPATPRRKLRAKLVLGGVLVTAAAISILLLGLQRRPPHIVEASIIRDALRASDASFTLSIELDRPAYLLVIAIDDRNEPWLFPIEGSTGFQSHRIESHEQFGLPLIPRPDDPRGAAEARYIVTLALARPLSAESVLEQFSDPVAPLGSNEGQLLHALDEIARRVETKFSCSARIIKMPR